MFTFLEISSDSCDSTPRSMLKEDGDFGRCASFGGEDAAVVIVSCFVTLRVITVAS